jgi:uncharacterized Zn finger protein (UPF0148 family)
VGQKYTAEMHEASRKEQDEKAAKEERERRERTERETARRVWLADGGKEGDFEKAWPKLRDEGRRQRVMDADRKAREMQRAHGPSRI